MICPECGGSIEVGSFPFCKGNPSDHMRGVPAIIDDALDHVQINGTKTPIHFHSKSDRRAWLKANGLEEFVRHQPLPGSDKSPHTIDWSRGYDAYTAANVRELLERAFQQTASAPPDDCVHFRPFSAADLESIDRQFNARSVNKG